MISKPCRVHTLEDASEITGRPITTAANGFRYIVWDTEKHHMVIRMSKCRDADPLELMVFGEPKPWNFGGEVRRGRPRQIWVRNPTAAYLKRLTSRG